MINDVFSVDILINILNITNRYELISHIKFEELVNYVDIEYSSYSDNFNNINLISYNGEIRLKKKMNL